MNAIAANELGVNETTGSTPPRWSPADDLLVWTVSRIDGGRRHGVEPDCHVVYALTPTHFVEQTRRYRASAQQCIDLLLSGKRVGRTQRKIELNTVMALRSDPRSGRLSIRTLNGTHYLEPVNGEEAEILREIAGEIDVRIPPGGARFSGTIAFGDELRSYSAEDDRRAAVAVEHARAEDESDTIEPPRYELPVTPVAFPQHVREYTRQTEVAEEKPADPPVAQSPYAAPVAESPYAAPVADPPMTPSPSTEPAADSPYAGPVAEAPVAESAVAESPYAATTTKSPTAESPYAAPVAESPYAEPVTESPYAAPLDESAATSPYAESPYAAPFEDVPPEQPVPQPAATPAFPTNEQFGAAHPSPESEAPVPAPTPVPSDITVAGGMAITYQPAASPSAPPRYTPDAATIARIQESPHIAAQPPTTQWQASLDGTHAAPPQPSEQHHPAAGFPAAVDTDPGAFQSSPSEDFVGYQNDEVDGNVVPPEAQEALEAERRQTVDPAFPAAFDRREQRSFRRQMEGIATEPVSDAPPAMGATDQAMTASEMYTEQPNMRAAAPPATEMPSTMDRRVEESAFPSVFDRRSLRSTSEETPGWIAPDSTEVSAEHHTDSEPADGAEDQTNRPSGPPVIGPPVIGSSGPATVSGGGGIGFNPDFDVNPFR